MNAHEARPLSSLKGWLYAAHGIYLILAGLALAVFCWLIPTLLDKVVSPDVIDPGQVPALARGVIEHRALMPLTALPAVLLGVASVSKVPLRWLWVALGLLSLLAPTVILLYTFVVTVGQLYREQPL